LINERKTRPREIGGSAEKMQVLTMRALYVQELGIYIAIGFTRVRCNEQIIAVMFVIQCSEQGEN